MELLERYLRQIERYLPLKERKETTKELRSLILDQVDEQAGDGGNKEQILYEIIREMGDPRTVAGNYSDSRPMISKEMEPILQLVLKIVSITLPLIVLFANALEYIFANDGYTIMEFLLHLVTRIPSALYSLLVGYGFVFIFFYLIEKYISPKFDVEVKVFHPDLLPEIPKKVFKVSLFESIFTILATVTVIYIVNFNITLISVYYDGNQVPILSEAVNKFIPLLNIGWFITILVHIYYAYQRRKNIPTKTIELINAIYIAIVLIFIATNGVFNDLFIEGFDLNFLVRMATIGLVFVAAATIIGSIVDYIKMFINLDALDSLEQKEKA
jgi:hypothetical protein